MADFTYPSNDFERVAILTSLLGSHWSNVYQGQDLVEQYLYARAQEEVQTAQDTQEAVDALDRQTVPVHHRDNWYMLTLKESERNQALLAYGEGAVYGNQPTTGVQYYYGVPIGRDTSMFPLPEALTAIPQIFNRVSAPSVSWTTGIDYSLSDNQLIFNDNPFDNPLLPVVQVYDGDQVVDREVTIWLFRSQWDWEHIYDHFGYVIGLKNDSSEHYRDMVNAVLEAYVKGTALKHLEQALTAMTGIPHVKSDGEVVEDVTSDDHHLLVITDKNVYRHALTATAIAAVGDTVNAGDFLTDGIEVFELQDGTIDASITALEIGRGFLAEGYASGVIFRNTTVNTTVTENVDGKTKIEWPLGGFPTDVTAFWEEVHAAGVASGTTLANLLDVRGANPPAEPTAASLPTTVNPLAWLAENALRFNTFIVRIKVSQATTGIGLNQSRLLRRVIQPWTAMILLYELEASEDPLIMDGAGDETRFGYEEDADLYPAGEPMAETWDLTTMISENPTLRLVNGICQ